MTPEKKKKKKTKRKTKKLPVILFPKLYLNYEVSCSFIGVFTFLGTESRFGLLRYFFFIKISDTCLSQNED